MTNDKDVSNIRKFSLDTVYFVFTLSRSVSGDKAFTTRGIYMFYLYIIHVYNVNMLFFYQSPVEFYWSIVLRYPYHIEVFLQMDLATPLPIMRLPMT